MERNTYYFTKFKAKFGLCLPSIKMLYMYSFSLFLLFIFYGAFTWSAFANSQPCTNNLVMDINMQEEYEIADLHLYPTLFEENNVFFIKLSGYEKELDNSLENFIHFVLEFCKNVTIPKIVSSSFSLDLVTNKIPKYKIFLSRNIRKNINFNENQTIIGAEVSFYSTNNVDYFFDCMCRMLSNSSIYYRNDYMQQITSKEITEFYVFYIKEPIEINYDDMCGRCTRK